jgi:hypothetical protein
MAKQRAFPWITEVLKPVDAELHHVGMCRSAHDAVAVSLLTSRVPAKRVAQYLEVTEATISQIKRGVRPVRDWMVKPFCYATGTNLLQQYIDLQNALVLVKKNKCDRERIEAIVYEMRRAA